MVLTGSLVAIGLVAVSGCGSGRSAGDGAVVVTKTVTTPRSAGADDRDTADDSGSSPPATAPVLSAADRASFAKLASDLPGGEGVAVSGIGRGQEPWVAGTVRGGAAWSTAKVPVAMAAINAGSGSPADLVAAITASDNAAAERLWAGLGSAADAAAAADGALRAAGDRTTRIQPRRLRSEYTAFGQTSWALADQVRFVAGMACAPGGPRVLELMGDVVADQRWGLGSQGRRAQFKGGWGPGVTPGAGDGWMDRQMGVIRIGDTPVAVAMDTTAAGHDVGTRNLTRLARWVATHVDVAGIPRRVSCD